MDSCYDGRMVISEACRWRVIRAILGWDMKTIAKKLGVNPNTIRNWERGPQTPNSSNRKVLAEICHEHKIAIRADGFPVPE